MRLPGEAAAGRRAITAGWPGSSAGVDVLSVFDRPDGQIRDEVIRKVIAGGFALNPNKFGVTVKSGIVTVIGQVERRAPGSPASWNSRT